MIWIYLTMGIGLMISIWFYYSWNNSFNFRLDDMLDEEDINGQNKKNLIPFTTFNSGYTEWCGNDDDAQWVVGYYVDLYLVSCSCDTLG